jgi:4-hydroxybenzoate polyprenyltransferase
VLDGVVSGAVAALGGAPPGLAARIGLAMTLLQLGIGTVNDLVDAPHDAGRKPGKPIPAGLVPAGNARVAAIALFGLGLGLAAISSVALAMLALVVMAIGLAYDLRLKGTAWSWLPFAVGIPILPVFGWLGATGTLHPLFAVLVPTAVLAGTALAIANSMVDIERDRAAGRTSVAARLGQRRAARVAAGLFGAVTLAAGLSLVVAPGGGPSSGIPLWAVALAVTLGGCAALAALATAGRPERAETAWRIEAVAIAVLAVLWIGLVLR